MTRKEVKQHQRRLSPTERAMQRAEDAQTAFDLHQSPETAQAKAQADRRLIQLQNITIRRMDVTIRNASQE
jgi:hypothetical protein